MYTLQQNTPVYENQVISQTQIVDTVQQPPQEIPIQTTGNSNIVLTKLEDLKTLDAEDNSLDDRENSSTEQVSESTSPATTDKVRRRPKYSLKQLSVQKVHPDGTVECQLVCKQKTISFKFNRFDTLPSDIIEGMIQEDCLKPGTHKSLLDQLQDVITQLQENPSKVPECPRYVQKVCIFNRSVCLRFYILINIFL